MEKFHRRAWVDASRPSLETNDDRVSEILRDLLRQVRPEDAMDVAVTDGQRIEALLTEYLKDTRCLHLPYSSFILIPNNNLDRFL
jgi:hypothetical protein